MNMTQDQFDKAKKQLCALSVAMQERERFMRHAIAFYGARDYEYAMFYQFMFLMYQDEVETRGNATLNTGAHRLWFILGGRP